MTGPLCSLSNSKPVFSVCRAHMKTAWSKMRTGTSLSSGVLSLLLALRRDSASATWCFIQADGRCQIRVSTASNAIVPAYRLPRPRSSFIRAVYDPSGPLSGSLQTLELDWGYFCHCQVLPASCSQLLFLVVRFSRPVAERMVGSGILFV